MTLTFSNLKWLRQACLNQDHESILDAFDINIPNFGDDVNFLKKYGGLELSYYASPYSYGNNALEGIELSFKGCLLYEWHWTGGLAGTYRRCGRWVSPQDAIE